MSDLDEGDRLGDTAYNGAKTVAKTRAYSGSDPRTVGTPGSGEVVHHPSHYTFGKYEVIDVLFDWQLAYPLDNVVKYVARAGKKGGPDKEIEDLKKAKFYLSYYIDQLEKKARK